MATNQPMASPSQVNILLQPVLYVATLSLHSLGSAPCSSKRSWVAKTRRSVRCPVLRPWPGRWSLCLRNNTISGHSHTRASCLQRNVFETKLVEEALTKIGDLLRIGFGEAGADIISRYARAVLLSSDAKTESNSNPLLVGSSDRNMSNLGNVEVLLPGQKGEYVHTQRYNVCTMT